MFFVQQYSRHEKYFGEMAVRFVVTDNYEDLLKTDAALGITSADYVDIFLLSPTELKVESSGDMFAVGNCDVTINSTACKKTTEKNALFFCLECKDRNKIRYAAKFFLGKVRAAWEDPHVSNTEFIGIFDTEVSADDLSWIGEEYDVLISPEREYSFSVRSLDYSLLEKALFTGDVYKIVDEAEVRIDNVYERIDFETDVLPLSGTPTNYEGDAYRKSYASQAKDGINGECNLLNLLNLYDVLRIYLDKAEAIIKEITGTVLTFEIVKSNLGLEVAPVIFNAYGITDYYQNATAWKAQHNQWMQINAAAKSFYSDPFNRKQLVICDEDEIIEGESNVFIHRSMIDYEYGFQLLDDQEKQMVAGWREYSFKSLSNVAELLTSLAKNFGCFLYFEYYSATSIRIKFISKEDISSYPIVSVRDATEATIDTSSEVEDEGNLYYGTSNNYARDGVDRFFNKIAPVIIGTDGTDLAPTPNFIALKEELSVKETQQNLKAERVLLTTSQTVESQNIKGDPSLQPLHPLNSLSISSFGTEHYLYHERLTTAIYIKTLNKYPFNYLAQNTEIWTPAGGVYGYVDGELIGGNDKTLVDYLNQSIGRDKVFYETEYEITVPYWNAFKNESVDSWKKIKLFSRIQINETIRRYNTISLAWEDYTPTEPTDFTVVGIERNPEYPETKITLQLTSRFAYGLFTGTPEEPVVLSFTFPLFLTEIINGLTEEVIYNETILAGDAVVLDPATQRLALATPSLVEYGYNIGMALVDGIAEDLGKVQWNGIVYNENYDFDMTKQLFVCQKYYSNLFNINQDSSDIPNAVDDMIIYLGVPLTDKSFLIDIHKFPFFEG